MRKATTKLTIIILSLFIILGLIFYWYEWRPSQIKKSCYEESIERARKTFEARAELEETKGYNITKVTKKQIEDGWYNTVDQERIYANCLRGEGL